AVAVLGLAGVDSFTGKIGKRDQDRTPKKDWVTGLLPELAAINWDGADVWIVGDTNVRTNRSIRNARWRLTNYLIARGARVLPVDLPEDLPGINGVDDLLGLKGSEFVTEVFAQQMKKPAIAALRFYASPHQDFKLVLPKVWEALEDSEQLHGRS